jgi:NADP-dependent 3-hydroxy acid dehydrogenase YdfG
LGAKVVIADLQLNEDSQKLVDGSGSNTVFKKTDVTNWKELNQAVTFAEEKFGSTPDVYIAGAGIFEPVSGVSCTRIRSTNSFTPALVELLA